MTNIEINGQDQVSSVPVHIDSDPNPNGIIRPSSPYDWKTGLGGGRPIVPEHSNVVNTFVGRRNDELRAETPTYQDGFTDPDLHVKNGAAIVKAAQHITGDKPRNKISLPLGPEAATTFQGGVAHDQHRGRQIDRFWPGSR